MSKKNRIKIKLVSSAKTGYFYTTTKNRYKNLSKLIFRKYDPVIKRHVLFKENKI